MKSLIQDLSINTIVAATEELPRHSEASILELKDGRLLMAWQRHEKSGFGSGDQAPSTISLMNSNDNGTTWSNFRVAAAMIPGCVNVYSPTLYRCADGSISLFFKRYTHLVLGEEQRNSYYRIDSYDEGETWSEETLIWENAKHGAMNHAAKRIASGITLLPIVRTEAWGGPNDHHFVSVLRSEDDLRTWTESNRISVPLRGLMEPCIAQHADGSLHMVMRTQLGSVFHSFSTDDGRTWSKPQATGLHAPESCPCIATIPGTDAQLVVWNNSEYDMNRDHYGKRTPLTLAISRDGLRTFSDYFNIETDPSRAFTNPSITITSDGLFLLNYWSCKYSPAGIMRGPIDLKLASFRINL
ncbi:MAG: exo-alpha-sialidase [Ruminococcaceae bacterium]|nr:exo-alpha-sialidase [Oscillospiraceae bacterium]